MLFDLRGRGRRRTVQVIYVTLAILMGGGLVLFGIGGNVSGGLFDAIGIGGDGDGGGNDALQKREETLEKQVKASPQNATAWAELARVRFQQAELDQATGQFTDAGRAQLRSAAQAWTRYLALNPEKPDPNVAALMLQVYGPAGLNDAKQAAAAAEVVTTARPSANSFFQLAVFAYAAGNTRLGDQAAKKTLELTPKDRRPSVTEQLDAAKKEGAGGSAGAATGGTAPVP